MAKKKPVPPFFDGKRYNWIKIAEAIALMRSNGKTDEQIGEAIKNVRPRPSDTIAWFDAFMECKTYAEAKEAWGASTSHDSAIKKFLPHLRRPAPDEPKTPPKTLKSEGAEVVKKGK